MHAELRNGKIGELDGRIHAHLTNLALCLQGAALELSHLNSALLEAKACLSGSESNEAVPPV